MANNQIIITPELEELFREHKLELVKSINRLGEGGFGSVHRVKHKNIVKAIKFMRRDAANEMIVGNEREAKKWLTNHKHVCITQIFAQTDDIAFIVMPIYKSDLLDYCKVNKLSDKKKRVIILGMIDGLKYIHSMEIIHSDIKPENILMTIHGVPKIADFGFIVVLDDEDEETDEVGGTLGYMAYETVNNQILCQKSDIASLGMTIYWFIQGSYYFTNNNIRHLDDEATWTEAFLKLDNVENDQLRFLLKGMLQNDRHHRFSAKECLESLESNGIVPVLQIPVGSTFVMPDLEYNRLGKNKVMTVVLKGRGNFKSVKLIEKLNTGIILLCFMKMAKKTGQKQMLSIFNDKSNPFKVVRTDNPGKPTIEVVSEYPGGIYTTVTIRKDSTVPEIVEPFWKAFVKYVFLTRTVPGKTLKQLEKDMRAFLARHN